MSLILDILLFFHLKMGFKIPMKLLHYANSVQIWKVTPLRLFKGMLPCACRVQEACKSSWEQNNLYRPHFNSSDCPGCFGEKSQISEGAHNFTRRWAACHKRCKDICAGKFPGSFWAKLFFFFFLKTLCMIVYFFLRQLFKSFEKNSGVSL